MSDSLGAKILSTPFPAPRPVATPEWPAADGEVFVRALTAAEKDRYDESLSGEDATMENLRARLVVLAACDRDGNRIFADGDAGPLGKQPASVVTRLWRAAHDMAGEGVEAEKNA